MFFPAWAAPDGGRLAASDIALKKPLPQELASDLGAYVGCIAGAITVDDYRRELVEAGFAAVDVLDTGADLNAYAKLENQSGCCSPRAATPPDPKGAPQSRSCCCSAPAGSDSLHERLAAMLRRPDVNEYAASVRVFAVKPQ